MEQCSHHRTLQLLGLLPTLSAILWGANAWAENRYSFGVEGFRDTYKENFVDEQLDADPRVDVHTDYGSVTAGFTHISDDSTGNAYFSAADIRYSQGYSNYKSASGAFNDIPDKEGEARVRVGFQMIMYHGVLMPYIGVGSRLFYDKFKVAGPGAFDRHITQFYAPIGATYQYTQGDWIFSPTLEFDPLFWGQVNSHLSTGISGVSNATNKQQGGMGVRGEFMIGQKYKDFGWEAGPFVRYWHVDLSNTAVVAPGIGAFEPANTRLQTGLGARINF